MILYDFECQNQDCGKVTECIVSTMHGIPNTMVCPDCGQTAKRIISASGCYTGNDDTDWLKEVCEVVDKDPNKPHCQQFLTNPTRTNYKRWMQAEGLRPLEPGEKPRSRTSKQQAHADRVRYLSERHRERTAITINSR